MDIIERLNGDEYTDAVDDAITEIESLRTISRALLEACEDAVATWDDDAPGSGLTERQALRKLKAAIAKATLDT